MPGCLGLGISPQSEPGIPNRPLRKAPRDGLRKKASILFHSNKMGAAFKFLILFIRLTNGQRELDKVF